MYQYDEYDRKIVFERAEQFAQQIERRSAGDSGLEAGLAATLLALKADESRLTGRTLRIDPTLYGPPPASLA